MELSPLFRELAAFPVERDDRSNFFFPRSGELGQLHRTGVRFRELPGGRVVSSIEMFERPPSAVATATAGASRESHERVAVTTRAFFDRAHIVVFDIVGGAVDPKSLVHIDRGGQRLAFDPTAHRLACANGSRAVWVFDARSGDREAFLRVGDPFLVDVVFADEGREVIVAAASGVLHAWRLRDPAPYAECPLGGNAQSMTLSPDGQRLVAFTSEGVSLVRLASTGPSIVWQTAPERPVWWSPPSVPTFGWLDDEHFALLIREQAPKDNYPLWFEQFLYVFAASSERWVARLPVGDYADIATDPRSGRLVYAEEDTARVYQFTPPRLAP